MAMRVETRYTDRLSTESFRKARQRRAWERAHGITSRVVVYKEIAAGATLLDCKGQLDPIIVNDVQQHHPNCPDSAQRACMCDCNDMEWWEPASHQ